MIIRIIVVLVLAVTNAPALHASNWYASPSATSGNGSITNPWSLHSALTNVASIQPGDTLWLRGGNYIATNVASSPTFKSTLMGTSNSPIIVRQYPGERAILECTNPTGGGYLLDVEGSYTWWWGFEVMNSDTNRYITNAVESDLRPDGIHMNQTYAGNGNKLINLIIHDNDDAVFLNAQSTNAEITGCIIYNNGCDNPNNGHGHDVYLQNNPNAGTKVCRDNVMLNSFNTGMHLYGSGSGGNICGINVADNIVFGSGTPSTHGLVDNFDSYCGTNSRSINLDNIVFGGNVGFTTGSYNWNFGWVQSFSPSNEGSVIVTNNLSVGGESQFYWWTNVVCSNNTFNCYPAGGHRYYCTNALSFVSDYNTFYGPVSGLTISTLTNGVVCYVPFATWQAMGYDTHSTLTVGCPTNPTVVIQKNPYESGRAHIAIVNWATNDNVSVDVSGVLSVGDRYQVRNAADYFGAVVVTGTNSGGTISLPMTNLSVAVPIGMQTAPAPTGPRFNAFVLLQPPPSHPTPPVALRVLY